MEIDILQLQRAELINILGRSIENKDILNVMQEIPRENFIPDDLRDQAYLNIPLDIGRNQTISQPYIVALMTQMLELKRDDKVLDIGTGSGYQAAVLSRLCKEVISIERLSELASRAEKRLKVLGYDNVTVITGNGVEGYIKEAPYNKIICAAAFDRVPNEWKNQLVEGGIIVMPIEKYSTQILVSLRKEKGELIEKEHTLVRFVPLINS
jgi:protein-L-isoaspartate(D-aspartate) O-methyltransferase